MRRAWIVIAAVWLVSTILWLTPGLPRPDGVGYFAYLPSTLLDRDLLFFDEWAQMRLIRPNEILFKDVTPTYHLGNHWTVGSALAWYPSYLAAHAIAGGAGFSAWHITAAAITSALAGLAVLFMGLRVAGGYALPAALAVWFGSPLLFYSTRHATMSHAISAAACGLVVLLSLKLREAATPARVFAVGMAIGFACAVRPQNIAIALVPLVLGDPRPLLRRVHFFILGGLLAALPQLIVSQFVYGGPFVFVNIGGRAHSWQMFTKFRPLETIFSWYHGLATWTPVLILALIGLVLLWKEDRGLARAGLATFAAQWLLLSILERWFWGGASFGQRRFDSCTLFFILGLAALFRRLPRWLSALLVLPCVGWTMMLFIAATRLNLNRFQTAPELLAAFVDALGDPRWRTFLGFTPPEMRGTVVMASLVGMMVAGLLLLAARRATALAALYFVAMSAFLTWCGMHPKYDPLSRALVLRHERGELPSAALRDMTGLLRDEAEYMRRTGRPEEAAAALAEAASVGR